MMLWDGQQRRLLIMEPLARVMIDNDKTWNGFLHGVYMWIYLRQCQEAWDKYMQREALKAVREAMTDKSITLSRDDIERIKRARMQEIAMSDVKPPRVEPFEFFCVRDTTDAQAQVVFVGHFDPETGSQELALWSEVKPYITNS